MPIQSIDFIVTLHNVCLKCTTDINGVASVTFQVPGTFGQDASGNAVPNPFQGFTAPYPQGRYIEKVEIWGDSFDLGDRVTALQLKDTDGVIPNGLRGQFPNYPVIVDLFETDVTETSSLKKGLFLLPTPYTTLRSINELSFVPSQLYFYAAFQGGVIALGKNFRINLTWGKKF